MQNCRYIGENTTNDGRPHGSVPAPVWAVVGFLLAGFRAVDGEWHHQALSTWNWAPHLVVVLLAGVAVYSFGLFRLWTKAGISKGVSGWEAASYGGGVAAIFIATISPIDAMSSELFSVHMVQHLIIIMIAAPFIVLGKPLFVYLWALPVGSRQAFARKWQRAGTWHTTWHILSQPLLVWSMYAITLWVWHVPLFYEAALENQYIHDAQHLAFLLTSTLFFWVLFNPMGRLRMNRGVGVMYLFTTSLHGAALGVFLALSQEPWYTFYSDTIADWGYSPLEDQQLAGMIMWMPACLIYILLAAAIFTFWLREIDSGDRSLAKHASLYYDPPEKESKLSRLLSETGGGS